MVRPVVRLPRREGAPRALFAAIVGLLAGVLITLPMSARTKDANVAATGSGGGASNAGEASAVAAGDGANAVAGAASGATAAGGPSVAAGASNRATAGATAGPAASSGGRTSGAATSRNVRGVTDNEIKLGFAWLDLGAIRAAGTNVDNGDRVAHMESILAALRQEKLLPVNGRDIKVAYRSYDILSAESQRSACVNLIQQDKVFMVIGDSLFGTTGGQCVTQEFQTAFLVTDGTFERQYKQGVGARYLFTMQLNWDQLFRNFIEWAGRQGFLQGKTIGLFRHSEADYDRLTANIVKPGLAKFGQKITSEFVSAAGVTTGATPAEYQLAIQQFRRDGVNMVLLLTNEEMFAQAASAQQWKPTYMKNDWLAGTLDHDGRRIDQAQWDGTATFTTMQYGSWDLPGGATAKQKKCIQDYQRHSGRNATPPFPGSTPEFIVLNDLCDMMNVIVTALKAAGRDLTVDALIQALERTNVPPSEMAMHGPTVFSPTKHDGSQAWRQLRYRRSCGCYMPELDAFQALYFG